ncbi:hypothetical protein [Thalassotalea litorea]|uniref:hypothetical protein n=1 Tax=Thalassotalea litorea TaxID=2020715 RepID=UPI0014851A52|nr:hypothetical protein [Thalassotalea litorea]
MNTAVGNGRGLFIFAAAKGDGMACYGTEKNFEMADQAKFYPLLGQHFMMNPF